MAKGRVVHKSLGASRKMLALNRVGGPLVDFCHALYPLLVVNADDYGREQGDAETAKYTYFSVSPHPVEDFEQALRHLDAVRLIRLYVVDGERYLEISNFTDFQNMKYIGKSRIPPPPEDDDGRPFEGAYDHEIPEEAFEPEPAPVPLTVTDAPKKPRPRKEKAAGPVVVDTRREALKAFVTATYKEHKGAELITDASDWVQFEGLLKGTLGKPGYTLGELKRYWLNFLTSKDPFHQRQGHPLRFFCGNINAFIKASVGYVPDTVGAAMKTAPVENWTVEDIRPGKARA